MLGGAGGEGVAWDSRASEVRYILHSIGEAEAGNALSTRGARSKKG